MDERESEKAQFANRESPIMHVPPRRRVSFRVIVAVIITTLTVLLMLMLVLPKKIYPDVSNPTTAVIELNDAFLKSIRKRDFFIQNFYLLLFDQLIIEPGDKNITVEILSETEDQTTAITYKGVTYQQGESSSLSTDGVFTIRSETTGEVYMESEGDFQFANSQAYFRINNIRGISEDDLQARGIDTKDWFYKGTADVITAFTGLSGIDLLSPLIQNFNPKILAEDYRRDPLFLNGRILPPQIIQNKKLDCMEFDVGHAPQGQITGKLCADTRKQAPSQVTIIIQEEGRSLEIIITIESDSNNNSAMQEG